MNNWAVIEISLATEGNQPTKLLRYAYRASQTGLVTLVLNGIEPSAVDRILDPIVARMPLTIPGVAYLPIDDTERVGEAARSAGIVFFATRRFRSAVLDLGVDRERIWPTRSILTRLGQGLDAPFYWLRPGSHHQLHRHLPIRHVGQLPETHRA
ncbi:hypothetical protein [Kaistia granuli]|uniref:hypothetical protein n=1 Tax=Kaistia granuli TaxID=363259 RepID=UPI0003663949|nr:hypothetical protein [Kaistia granuli]